MGYTALASWMGKFPEAAVFRRFSALNAKNLLYLQAELIQLEIEYEKKCAASRQMPNPDGSVFDLQDCSLEYLKSVHSADGGKTQWEIFQEIREKLKDYNEALNQQVIASSFSKPHSHDLKFLKAMCVNDDAPLANEDVRVWVPKDSEDHDPDDLVALKARSDLDFLSKLFINIWSMVIGRFKEEENTHSGFGGKYASFEDENVVNFVNVITTVISSVLPIASVIILYFVSDMRVRLGIVAAFVAAFSLTLALVTEAKRVEIFTATAGFAAVLVIFVGSTSSSPAG